MGLKLIYGPANSGKTGYIHKKYIESVLEQKSPILVLPAQADVFRSSKELSKELNSMIGGSILTFGNLFSHVISVNRKKPQIIDQVQRLVLLKKSVVEAQLNTLSGSSKFSGFLKKASKSINELISCGISPEDLEHAVGSLGPDDAAIMSEFIGIYSNYIANLSKQGLIEYCQLGFLAVEDLKDISIGRELFVHKFEQFSRAEKMFIEEYAKSNPVTVSYSFDATKLFSSGDLVYKWLGGISSDSVRMESDESNYSNRALHQIEQSLFAKGEVNPVKLHEGIHMMAAAGSHNEVELAGSEIAKLIKGPGKERFKPNEVAVIVRDASYHSEITRVFKRYGLPVSVKADYRIHETNFGRSFIAFYKGLVHRKKEDLLEFFRSEFSHLPDSRFYRLEKDSLSGRKDYKDLLEILTERSDIKDAILKVQSADLSVKPDGLFSLARHMIEGYLRNTETGILVNNDLRGLDLGAYMSITEALESLKTIFAGDADINGGLSDNELINIIGQIILRAPEKPEEERIQVLSPNDARGRRFKVVFIMGLNEGSYPEKPGDDPFLSANVRNSLRSAGLSDLQEVEFSGIEEMKLFYMLVTRARNKLYLSYCFSDEKGSQKLQSNYLSDLLNLFSEEEKKQIYSTALKKDLKDIVFSNLENCPNGHELKRTIALRGLCSYSRLPAEITAEIELAKERAANVSNSTNLLSEELIGQYLGEDRSVGVTEIEKYIKCRYKWFAESVLKVGPLFDQFSKASVGRIFHNVMARIYKSLEWDQIKDLSSLPVDEMLRLAEGLVDAEIKSIDLSKTEALLSKDILMTLLKNAFFSDKERGGTFLPRYFEQPFNCDGEELSVFSSGNAGDLSFHGRIDRIDICDESKKAVIVDYKTGNIPDSFKPGDYLQIVLYALAAGEALLKKEGVSPVAAAFQYPKQGKSKALVLEDIDGPQLGYLLEKKSFAELLDSIQAALLEAVLSLSRGDISPDAEDCRYCELDQLCRKKAN